MLKLTINKKDFDLIGIEIKKEILLNINSYWAMRLTEVGKFREFDSVVIKNKDSEITLQFKTISVKQVFDDNFFIVVLGNILKKKNYKTPNWQYLSLSQKQKLFSILVPELINFAILEGYEVTFGDAFRDKRCPYGNPDSLHHIRLAIDLNFFIQGKYLNKTKALKKIGEFWESLGGSWGGRFNDGNHFSIEHKGMR